MQTTSYLCIKIYGNCRVICRRKTTLLIRNRLTDFTWHDKYTNKQKNRHITITHHYSVHYTIGNYSRWAWNHSENRWTPYIRIYPAFDPFAANPSVCASSIKRNEIKSTNIIGLQFAHTKLGHCVCVFFSLHIIEPKHRYCQIIKWFRSAW